MKRQISGIAAVLAVILALAVPALAQQKHDSNSLHKFGKAIQYPFRKASTNLSVDVHRAEGRKSVVRNRHTRRNYIVTPKGHKYPIRHHHH